MRVAACAALCAAGLGAESGGPRVIVIGVDGLSVDGVLRARAPHLRRLMDSGAWTLEARGVMPTLSSPNWASMVNGAGPEQHGVTSNGYLKRKVEFQPVCAGPEGKFPTIFHVLRSQRPSSRIGVFHDWGGFSSLIEHAAPDVMRHERGAGRTTEAAIRYWLAERPALLFLHLDNADHAGHSRGWGSAAYYRSVAEADALIGDVLDMLDRAGEARRTYVLVSSDHGGTPRGHGRNSLDEIRIPWILTGPDVARGHVTMPVNTFDTAATLAWIFGVTPPDCWIGRPVRAAFTPTAVIARDRVRSVSQAGCAAAPVPALAVATPGAFATTQRPAKPPAR